ncbi:ATP-binding protein [Flavobacterium soli]|uniref:ATP-binding protein n=1 Tax=Flavobacterium soli TaxID=344881 RepID=UPI000422BCBA|nr:ATP-binding protein [Flavobacterium soli]
MKIKDIVNRDIVNLTNCEFEPIHIPGSIQPHGFLIGIDSNSWKIDFCSGNISNFIALSHQNILGKDFKTVFGKKQEIQVQHYISKDLFLSSTPLQLDFMGKFFLCTIHKSNTTYILEAEPFVEASKELADVYSQTSQFLSYMNETHTLQELCAMVARGTREITGYDRVMIYRFDKDYNGEVFAESVKEDLEPFLGLHYPHTDIPVQARQLYMQNLLRLIVDIDYIPVPLYTVDDGNTTKNLDLSLSILRSTSPIHVQYLQNMGVGATLTISLIHQKKLWGLIACHHYSPKNLSPEIRLAAQLQGHFITSQIDIRQSNEEYDVARKSNLALEKMISLNLQSKENSFQKIIENEALLEICNAAGVAIIFNGTVYKNGVTPDEKYINKLIGWINNFTKEDSFSTDKLSDFLLNADDYCQEASGIIYHSLSIDNHDCIIWFRPESLTEINWAGDPNKAIIKDVNGLYPRNSFELYKEIVKCQSKIWLQPELNAAANYAHTLQKQFSLVLISQEEEKYRKLSELLKETNSELENINWISTHDLQEPLRKIQMISSRLLGKEDEVFSETVINSVQRMNHSAKRMQTLLIDILKYTRIQHIDDTFELVKPENILAEVLSDLNEHINEQKAIINIHELPEINGIPFLMKQLFSNLIQNSLKYSFQDKAPIINIRTLGIQEINELPFQVLEFADNGIGFEQEFAENIFNIFSRLHNQEKYKGSGVGLALCKKIMQVHKGLILAEGISNEGAIFRLYFPLNS